MDDMARGVSVVEAVVLVDFVAVGCFKRLEKHVGGRCRIGDRR